MKATLEFTLPEEQEEFDAARQGMDLRCAVRAADEAMRGRVKYGGPPDSPEETLAWARATLHSALKSYGINLLG